jgi:hypothetical protein
VKVANGFYRCSITGTFAVAGSMTGRVYSGSDANFVGTGQLSFYFFGHQIEQLPFASSFIPTTVVRVTRAADIFTMSGADAYWQVGTAYIQTINLHGWEAGALARLVGDSGGANTHIFALDNTHDSSYNGSAQLNANTFPAGSFSGGLVKCAEGYNGTGRSITGQGGTPNTDAGTYPVLAGHTAIGSGQAGANPIYADVKILGFWNVRASNTDLSNLTT